MKLKSGLLLLCGRLLAPLAVSAFEGLPPVDQANQDRGSAVLLAEADSKSEGSQQADSDKSRAKKQGKKARMGQGGSVDKAGSQTTDAQPKAEDDTEVEFINTGHGYINHRAVTDPAMGGSDSVNSVMFENRRDRRSENEVIKYPAKVTEVEVTGGQPTEIIVEGKVVTPRQNTGEDK